MKPVQDRGLGRSTPPSETEGDDAGMEVHSVLAVLRQKTGNVVLGSLLTAHKIRSL